MSLTRRQGIPVTEAHRAFKLRVTHTASVIHDQHATVGAIPLEIDAHLARPGGDAVVNDIGQGRCRRIAQTS